MKFIKVLIGIFAVIGVIVVCLGVGFLFGMKNQTTTSVPDESTITPVVTENLIPESTVTNVPTPTSEPEPTATSVPTPTSTPTPKPTSTPVPTATSTPTPAEYTYRNLNEMKLVNESFNLFSDASGNGSVKCVIDNRYIINVTKQCNETGWYGITANLIDTNIMALIEVKEGFIHPDVYKTLSDYGTQSSDSSAEEKETYTFTNMSVEMVPIGKVNVRDLPSSEGNKLDTISEGKVVMVQGKCNETGWYKIAYYSDNLEAPVYGYADASYFTEYVKPTATPTPKPTKEASITASKTELLFTSVEPQTIYITFNVDGQFKINGKFKGEKIVTSSWGEWQEDGITMPVTITPNFNGTTTIQYYIVDTNLSIDIKITVDIESLPEIPELGEEQIVVSQTEMIFTDMEPQILYVKVKDGKEMEATRRLSNASYEAGKWSGNVLSIIITPKSSGISTLEINLKEDESVCVKVKIRVEVNPDRQMFTSLETVDLADAYAGAIVKFGTYEQDNNLSNGAEEIEWLVLDVQDGKALLLSKYALDEIPYSTVIDGISASYGNGPATPAYHLEQWMTFEFYKQAFTEAEKKQICTSIFDGYWYYVFPLSKDEIDTYFTDEFLSDEYGNSLLKRAAVATPYAISQGASVSLNEKSEDYGLTRWWTRTTTGESFYHDVYYIESDGSWSTCSTEGYEIINRFTGEKRYFYGCARPAIWVDIE